ncbi:UBX domain [Arabidopsis suecica]|uniref:UBX domain n=1 Tax=Arabidopsis suecica TaxID=45249 RepID=A0A8T2BTL5_ARASU|nr:UBX domain [Arabidopsis suecica]
MESDHQRKLVSSFLEIAVDQTVETAIKCLNATNWKVEEAINLFFLIDRRNQSSTQKPSDSNSTRLSSLYRPSLNLLFNGSFEDAKATSSSEDLWLLVHIQSKTELPCNTLNRDLWSNDDVSKALEFRFMLWQVYDHTKEGRKISSFYKIDSAPPVVLLIVPITGKKMHTWSGEIKAQSFLEDLKKYIDATPHEYFASMARNMRVKTKKICHLDRDMATFMEDDFDDFDESVDERSLNSYIREVNSPSDRVVVSSSGQELEDVIMTLSEHEEETCLSSDLFGFPVLTEEPKGDCDRSVVCSISVRFPNGRRKQRKFLKSEPIQLLWSFCYSHMEESEKKAFKLVQAIPGASKTLDYGANATFDQSGIANSIILVTWE